MSIPKNPHLYWKILVALSLVHFCGDFYSSFISPLCPVFMDKMGLSRAQVGIIAGISRFLMFSVQPMSGYCADRHPSRSFILIGLLMSILVIPLAGMTSGFCGLGHSQTPRGRHDATWLFKDPSANPGECLAADSIRHII